MCALDAIQPEVALDQVPAAEDAGFDFVVVPDPFHPWVDDVGAAGFAWSFLGAAAARTERIGLMTTVTAPILRYHPAVIAQAAATVDRLSGGRFRLGVGTGHALHDGALGWPGITLRERVAWLREAIAVIRGLLAGDEVSFEGEHVRVRELRLGTPPLHEVEIWMAANGPRSAAMAAELADGLVVSVKDPSRAQERVVDPFRRAARAAAPHGVADPPVLATRWSVLGRDEAEMLRAIAPMRGVRVPDRDRDSHPATLRARADAMTPSELLSSYSVVGDASELVGVYEPLVRELGAAEVIRLDAPELQ